MDYKSEEFQKNKISHKRKFINVLNELIHSRKNRHAHESMRVKHEYVEFLQYVDFRRDLKEIYPDLVVSIGQKYGRIELRGPASQIVDATVIINEQIRRIKEKYLTPFESHLVWNIVAKNRWNDYFTRELSKCNIKAKACVGPSQKLVILAYSDEECEKAYEIMLNVIREDTFSIGNDCSVESDGFQSLVSKLQRGSLVQIEVLREPEECLVKIIGIEEDKSQAIKEITKFIKEEGINIDTYRPQVSENIWNFLANQVNKDCVKKVAKDLEQYSVSIEISGDHEQFVVRGFKKGIELCKLYLSKIAAMIVEEEKKLEYPGIRGYFLNQAGKEQLQMIKKEMGVEIELVRRGRAFSKAPVPLPRLPRTTSLPNKDPESYIYDTCNFTTEEGINVSWKYGSIENEVADVLVNSAHSNLNKLTACGRALMARGGSCFQEACKPHINIRPGDIVTTESGNLSSKYVIHAVCRNLRQFKEVSPAHEFLRMLIRKILEKCQELGGCSLALPMIGAGQHGFPETVVLQIIQNEVNQLSSSHRDQLVLKTIRVIVFQSKFELRRKSVPLPARPCIIEPSTLEQHDENDGISSNEISFGQVRVHLCGIDLKQYQADAHMNLSSTHVKVSTICFQSADFPDTIAEEPMKPPPGTVLMTKATKHANVKYYMHCVPVSFDVTGLERAIKACLIAAQFCPLNSILISATGITSLGVGKKECANAILNASKMFSSSNFMMDISVVETNIEIMPIFEKAFEEKLKEQNPCMEFHASDQTTKSENETIKHQCSVDSVLSFGVKEEVIFRVVGFCDAVNMSIQKIVEHFNRSKVRKCVKDDKLVSGFWKHNSEIKKLSKEYQVVITLSAEEISFEGIAEQVFECKDALTQYLNKHDEKQREMELKQQQLERYREISKSAQWSYSDVNVTVLFDEILNGMIEMQFRAGNEDITIPGMGNTYEIDFGKMIIWDIHTDHTALLARKDVENTSVLPKFWEPQAKEEKVQLVILLNSSHEYQKVIDLFGDAKNSIRTEKVERIQNPRLYKLYVSKKESMGKEANEKQLFHGTKSENVSSINTNNFNRRFSGINGTRFGDGVYFARDASYSVRYSLKNNDKDKDSVSHMYVAKVLVGKSVKGKKNLRVLPKRNDPRNPELFYDSAVDDTEDPSIFVTFDDHQCYPEYLITFKVI